MSEPPLLKLSEMQDGWSGKSQVNPLKMVHASGVEPETF
jgi:hypothetical protein